ncbi:MAG: beta-ketoacyl-[acyl-carrier-protein] synthase family protein, partial [Firmicutes bacterium]|nr:beta-ketoacyl-[acyl-carrier-protein] synthase family protein [Bacillota bacterium]
MGSVPTLLQNQSEYDQGGSSGVPARLMSQIIPNMPAAHIAMRWGLHGPLLTISTACASSLDAIGQAAHMVERGDVDFAIAGGVDSLLAPLVYHSLVNARAVSRATDPLRASRPFDRDRDGFVMGEGAGIVVLEREETARLRRQPILARILGYGSVADAHHVTSPEPSGRWEALAMKLALKEAGLSDEKPNIDALIAHGTGTKVGDAAEIRAINDVFGRHSPALDVTSIKGHIGHSMAASGVMAVIAGVEVMMHGQLPATMGTTTVDPEAQFAVVLKHPKTMDIRQIQINAFGFGGQNAAIVMSR